MKRKRNPDSGVCLQGTAVRGGLTSPSERNTNPPAEAAPSDLETFQGLIASIDTHLESLRTKRTSSSERLEQVVARETQLLRAFADAAPAEKSALDTEMATVTTDRTLLERECKALAIAIEELETERRRIYPELERLQNEVAQRERKQQLEDLRLAHEKDLQHERACDRALLEAREKSNRSYFAWRTAVDSESLREQLAATEVLKFEWQRNSGPNAGRKV